MSGSAAGEPSPGKPAEVPAIRAEVTKVSKAEADHEGSPMQIGSSPPAVATVAVSNEPAAGVSETAKDRGSVKSDSEAETIVLPGKENDTSPTKRKSIKHEEDSVSEQIARETGDVEMADADEPSKEAVNTSELDESLARQGKKKKKKKKRRRERDAVKDSTGHEGGNSSDLSSVLSSPTTGVQSSRKGNSESDEYTASPSHAQRQEPSASADRGSRKRQLELSARQQRESADPSRRKDRRGSDAHGDRQKDGGEMRAARQPTSPANPHAAHGRLSPERSASPRTRPHRRAASSQSTSNALNGKSRKRRRVAPPSLATGEHKANEDDQSDSSASDSAHTNAHLTKLGPHDSSLLSPVKMAPHKKHRDQIGRTFLARACAANETENVKIRLRERPDDIDVADNAGNTPLQISSLEGSAEIVKLLIDHGCDIDRKNNEKETPLIDAVENGHLEVVRLLLAAGANPRQGNLNGEEPLDLLDPEDPSYIPIRDALNAAKNKSSLRRQSEDQSGAHNGSASKESGGRLSRGASAASPRHSPPAANPRSPPAIGMPPRRKTVRSEATRNDLLWMKPTAENLRDRAGRGDMAGVANILNVLSQADSESLIAAARGGHDEVIQLLLGIGGADADAEPLGSLKVGFNTPMLAAIGRGNDKVIQLLLEQPKFDPTRRDHRGQTYYEIAKERQGLNWEREYDILKEAFDRYGGGRKNRPGKDSKSNSPGSVRTHREADRNRERDRENKSSSQRPESSSSTLTPKKKSKHLAVHPSETSAQSPTRESRRESNEKEKRLSKQSNGQAAPANATGSSHRDKKAPQHASAVSDTEALRLGPPREKRPPEQRTGSGAMAVASDDEAKPRRKLVSGKVLKGDREKKRRSSNVSSHSPASALAEGRRDEWRSDERANHKKGSRAPSSGATERDPCAPPLKSSASDSDVPRDRLAGRDKPAKREDSKDRLSAIRGEGRVKRPRVSESPVRSPSRDSDGRQSDADDLKKKKRRRLELEAKAVNMKKSHDGAATDPGAPPVKTAKVTGSPDDKTSKVDAGHRDGKAKDSHGKAVRRGVDRTDIKDTKIKRSDSTAKHSEGRSTPDRELLAKQAKRKEDEAREAAARKEDEAREAAARKEHEAREAAARKEQEKKEKQAREEKIMQATIEREQAEKRQRQEAEAAERVTKEADDRRHKAEADQAAKQAQIEREEADRQAKIAREAEEARAADVRRAEEVERQARLAREEEEARAAREKHAQEMRRRRLEEEQQQRREAERRRVELEKQEQLELVRRQAEEERMRREKLPWSLARLATLPTHCHRTADVARQFSTLYTVTFKQLAAVSDMTLDGGLHQADDLYFLNVQAAGLLGVKDLALSQYSAWFRKPVSGRAKYLMWLNLHPQLAGRIPWLKSEEIWHIQLRFWLTQAKFRSLEPVFWIKLSDFMDVVPRYPHLQDVKIHTTPCADLDREDTFKEPFRTDPSGAGWAVTPYENGTFTTYDPSRNRELAAWPKIADLELFRKYTDPAWGPKPAPTLSSSLPNGTGHL